MKTKIKVSFLVARELMQRKGDFKLKIIILERNSWGEAYLGKKSQTKLTETSLKEEQDSFNIL